MSRDEVILLDIVRAAHLVLEFKRGMDKADVDVPDLLSLIEPLLPE